MKRLIQEMKREHKLLKKNIEESIEAHLSELKGKFVFQGASLDAIDEVQGIIDDLKYDINVELEKLV